MYLGTIKHIDQTDQSLGHSWNNHIQHTAFKTCVLKVHEIIHILKFLFFKNFINIHNIYIFWSYLLYLQLCPDLPNMHSSSISYYISHVFCNLLRQSVVAHTYMDHALEHGNLLRVVSIKAKWFFFSYQSSLPMAALIFCRKS